MNNNDFYKWYGDDPLPSRDSWYINTNKPELSSKYLALKEIQELKTQIAHMNVLIDGLREAIVNEGPNPRHHRSVYAKHRKQWPTLWASIDAVLSYTKHQKNKFR